MDFFNSLLKKLDKAKDGAPPAPIEPDKPVEIADELMADAEETKAESKEKQAIVKIDDLTAQMEYGKKLLVASSNPFDREYYKGVVATLEHLLQNLSFNQEVLGHYLQYAEQSGRRAPLALEREYYNGVIATLRHLQEETKRQPI